MGSVAENQGSPHHAWELHREKRTVIGFILYDVLGLGLQLETIGFTARGCHLCPLVLLQHS